MRTHFLFRLCKALLVISCSLSLSQLTAQFFPIANGSLNACEGFLTDDGGRSGNYLPGRSYIFTLCPGGGQGSHARLQFPEVALGSGDVLMVFDGADTTAAVLLDSRTADLSRPFTVRASAANPTGCLTLFFQADDQEEAEGWNAEISCTSACQAIEAVVDSTFPAAVNGYIDICPGQEVIFNGSGRYPQNNVAYNHNDLNSSFRWDFDDGAFAEGRTVFKTFDRPGGYQVRLLITDPFGCTQLNTASVKVRVAAPADFTAGATMHEAAICLGDSLPLTSVLNRFDPEKSISAIPAATPFSATRTAFSGALIPDNGDSLVSSLSVTGFDSDQVLADPSGIQAICLQLEHSAGQDLTIQLECPGGQTLLLQTASAFKTDSALLLGEPVTGDDLSPEKGRTARYCWIDLDTLPRWEDFPGASLPPADYSPRQGFSQLTGCPLNGTWRITLFDTLQGDNGFLDSWSLDFASDLFPNLETFAPELTAQTWRPNDGTVFNSPDSILVRPNLPGTAFFPFSVTDRFGCTSDTLLTLDILSPLDTSCSSCTDRYLFPSGGQVCQGDTVFLGVQANYSIDSNLLYRSNPDQQLGAANFPPENPYRAPLRVSGNPLEILDDPSGQIASVCLNILTDWNEDLDIFLQAPSGERLELSTGNGGSFDNYLGTCFTPAAASSIRDGAPPFSGNYQPEGDWSNLAGARVNGQWTLVVSDAFDPLQFGSLLDWSIEFQAPPPPKPAFQDSSGISCLDCPRPYFIADTSRTIVLSVRDGLGCSYQETLDFAVTPIIPAPEVFCERTAPDQLSFFWTSLADIAQYRLHLLISGQDSLITLEQADTFLIVGGLQPGDSVTLEVQGVRPAGQLACRIETGSTTCIFEPCFLKLQADTIIAVSCAGLDDGRIEVSATGGEAPYFFFLDDQNYPAPEFGNLPAGEYTVRAEDNAFCSDSIRIVLPEPPTLTVSAERTDSIRCAGENTGAFRVNAEGGNGMYFIDWENSIPDGDFAPASLPAGTYRFTVTDNRGCRISDSLVLGEPPLLSAMLQQEAISCNGASDGRLLVAASGGVAPLRYQWASGSTDSLLTGLPPGAYAVTLTDANGCALPLEATLEEPQPLALDSFSITNVNCAGRQNGQVRVFVSGGTGTLDYQWSDTLAQFGPLATNLKAGNIRLTVSDERGCRISETFPITEPAPLTLAVDADSVRCQGGSDGEAVAVAAGGTGPYNISWEDGQNGPAAVGLAAGNYRLTATDANGCRTTGSVAIGEPDMLLTVDIMQTIEGCFGEGRNQAQVMAVGGVGNYRYLWSNGATGEVADDLDSLEYTVTVTDDNGCAVSDTLAIRDLPPLNPNLIVNQPSCFGSGDGAIGINFVGGRPFAELGDFTFVWNTGERGATIRNLVGDSTYSVTVTDLLGCTGTESRLVRQPRPIDFDLEKTDISCNGLNDGSARVTNILADSRDFRITWDANTGGQTGNEATGLPPGNYSVTVTDEFSCFNTGQVRIEEPGPIQLFFTPTENRCFGDTTGAIAVTVSGGSPDYAYRWSNGATAAAVTGLIAGNYSLTVTDNRNCRTTGSVSLPQPAPILAEVTTESSTCFGDNDGSITVQLEGGTPPFAYSLDNRNFNGSPIFVGLTPDIYYIYIRDAAGCFLLERAEVEGPEEFLVDAGPPTLQLALGDSITLRAEAFNPQGAVDFNWIAPYDGTLSCTACDSTIAAPENSIFYRLVGTDSLGCQAEDRIQVLVRKTRAYAVPTAFSPNGDGLHDRLQAHGIDGAVARVFQVFDRWGEKVFEVRDWPVNQEAGGWDGSFRGQPLNTGVYVWYAEVQFADGRTDVFRGQTTLIR